MSDAEAPEEAGLRPGRRWPLLILFTVSGVVAPALVAWAVALLDPWSVAQALPAFVLLPPVVSASLATRFGIPRRGVLLFAVLSAAMGVLWFLLYLIIEAVPVSSG